MRVCVLGCGPAGLLASLAVEQAGHTVTIISSKEPSQITGAQYLHRAIPDLTPEEPVGMLNYVKIGSAAGYAEKVYGRYDAPTSWHAFPSGEYPAWSLQVAYDRLWTRFEDRVLDQVVGPRAVGDLCDEYDLVLSTIPAKRLCFREEHQFESQAVAIAPVHLINIANLIVYNGRLEDGWYRTSNIFGHASTEWSEDLAPAGLSAARGIKPIATDCDCHEALMNFHRLGRFGRWEKSQLVSDAYEQAQLLLSNTATAEAAL